MAALLNFADIVKVDRDAHNGVELLAAIDYFKDGKNKLFMLFPQGTISDLNKKLDIINIHKKQKNQILPMILWIYLD